MQKIRIVWLLLIASTGWNAVHSQSYSRVVHYAAGTDLIYQLREKDSVIRIYESGNGSHVKNLVGAKGVLDNFKVNHTGNCVAGFAEGNIFIWKLPDTIASFVSLGNTLVKDVAFLPGEDNFVVTAFEGFHLVKENAVKASIAVDLPKSATGIKVSKDGKRAVATRPSGGFYLLDLENFRVMATTDSKGGYSVMTFLPGNNFFYHNAIWDAAGTKQLFSLAAPRSIAGLRSVVATSDGNALIGSLYDSYVYDGFQDRIGIWNTGNGQLTSAINAHKGNINDLVLDKEEQFVASVSSDKTAAVWNIKDGSLVTRFSLVAEGTKGFFSKDGKRLVIQQFKAPIQVWSIADGKLLFGIE